MVDRTMQVYLQISKKIQGAVLHRWTQYNQDVLIWNWAISLETHVEDFTRIWQLFIVCMIQVCNDAKAQFTWRFLNIYA